ncbi:MAG TPA: serine hydrolase [Pyrinomonadaceae bacterium]|jgi:CubicO group peptidase (beta-lactamase class C family)|nr:serine hydrolase [Pyrinomonadaceae bacterium]
MSKQRSGMKRMFETIGRVALLSAACLLGVTGARAQQLASQVDIYANNEIRANNFSGTILIARDGRVLLSKGYGMANIENDVLNSPQMRFRIGSLTKQFTAMAVMILQERGVLNVQDSICTYLPNCPEMWRPITIHHLLTHTSGLPDFTYNLTSAEDDDPIPSVTRNIDRLRTSPLEFTPGARFSYCNSGYVLLGHIIEKASGNSYQTFVRENIFVPLGMSNTGYDFNGRILKHRATGYSLRGGQILNARQIDMSVPFSAGGLYSTVEDLYLWDQALYTTKLISEKSLKLMFTPFKEGYAYGWYAGERFGRRVVSHGGMIEGYTAFIERFPEERVTVIVLSNLDSTPTSRFARDLAAITFNLPRTSGKERRAINVDPRVYDAYVGQYELSRNFIITITKENDRLMGKVTGRPKIELFPESATEFFVKELDAQITFVGDGTGKVTHAILHLDGHEAQAKKVG